MVRAIHCNFGSELFYFECLPQIHKEVYSNFGDSSNAPPKVPVVAAL